MSLRLLVVDDAPERLSDIEQEIAFSFAEGEIEMHAAGTVAEAEEVFSRRGPFDVVLLDVHIPNAPKASSEGGLYLLKQFALRSPKTVYVISSGSSHDRYTMPSELAGVLSPQNFFCIPKTADRTHVVNLLRNRLTPPPTLSPSPRAR